MPKKKNPDATPAITNPLFTDETAARQHLEAMRWPNGPFCPKCGETENVSRLEGAAHRPGLIQCNACRAQFSVTIGTLFERSHLPLHKWLLAFHLMASSKKGISAHQLHRMLDITYKTAWFMAHRIREAMADRPDTRLGGGGKIVEADETYWGLKRGATKQKGGYQHKNTVLALVERGGNVRSFHVASASAETVKETLRHFWDVREVRKSKDNAQALQALSVGRQHYARLFQTRPKLRTLP